jgi:hypothetical protein
MNVTWAPRVTMMSFGLATLLVIVIVVARTAVDGVVDGEVGDVSEVELGLEPELPHAAIAVRAAAVQAAAIRSRIFIFTLDLKTACP